MAPQGHMKPFGWSSIICVLVVSMAPLVVAHTENTTAKANADLVPSNVTGEQQRNASVEEPKGDGGMSEMALRDGKSRDNGPQLKCILADALPHHGESHGCRRIEHTIVSVSRPNDANVSLRSVQIGNEVIYPRACISARWYSWSTSVESHCTNLIVFRGMWYFVTQNTGADGRDDWTIEGLVECDQEPQADHRHDAMRKHNAGHHRKLEFNFSGNVDSSAQVHIVARHGGLPVFEDRLPLSSSPRGIVEAKFMVNPDMNKLLIRTGGVYEQDPECYPEVHAGLSPVWNGTSAQLIVYASVPELCGTPAVRVLATPGGPFSVLDRRPLTDPEMQALGVAVDSSSPFVSQSIQMNFPAGRDLPSALQVPIRVQDVVLAATVDTYPLWPRASNLWVNLVGPVGVGKSSTCGWLYCFFFLDVLERDTINECLLHTNPFERGQNSHFTHTTRRLSRESKFGVKIADNPGTVQHPIYVTDDKTPDDRSLEYELNGHCSGDCSPGECRRRDKSCNSTTVQCPDVDFILVPLAGVDSNEPVGGKSHPLYNEHKRLAYLQEGQHNCKHSAVIVVQVKQAVAGNAASKMITDPAISVSSALYRETERDLCRKARNALHANDGTLCVAMSAHVPQDEVDDEWIRRYLDMARSLEKKLLGAKKKAAEKTRSLS